MRKFVSILLLFLGGALVVLGTVEGTVSREIGIVDNIRVWIGATLFVFGAIYTLRLQ